MAGTFADFLRWPDRQVVVLAELTPSLVLSGWTALGGPLTGAYVINVPPLAHDTRVPGGVYRRCVGLRENGTELTPRASAADVAANAGSWFWNDASGDLYVRTTGSVHPDTLIVMHAQVTFYVASCGIVLNRVDGVPDTGVYYQPWLSGDVPTLVSELEDLLSGQKNTMSGSVTLTNGHGLWHEVTALDGSYVWKNKRVRLFLGGSYNGLALDRSQYVALRTMRVEDVSCDETKCVFKLAPLLRATERQLPVTPFFESAYPNLGEGVRGTKKWIGYGRTMMRPDLTDTTSHGVWTVADAAFQTLTAVHGVNAIAKSTGARTALALTTDYTVNLATCTVTIVNATYAWQTYDIEVDVTGRPENTFSDIVRDLLQRFLGVQTSELDTAAFIQAKVDAPEELSLWIKSERTIASILSTAEAGKPSLERSVLGTVQQTIAGTWTCWIWDPSYDPLSLITLTKEDFAAFTPEPKLERIYSTVQVHYQENHSRKEWGVESASDARTEYLAETAGEPLFVHTYLRGVPEAQTLAQRLLLVSRALTMEIEFRERGARLAQHLAGQKVLVTFSPAPSVAGAYTEEPFELLRVQVTHAPQFVVAGRLGNLKGVGRYIGHWMLDSSPDWSAASEAERAKTGYWSDDNGFISPGDPSSKDRSLWW